MKRTIPAAMLVALVLAGCGGGSDASTSSPPQGGGGTAGTPSGAYAHQAEAICSEMVSKSHQMSAEFSSRTDLTSNALAMTTENLFRPAIPIVEADSRRLRTLKQESKSVAFESYVSLFDPILAVLHQRVTAGETGDSSRAHDLELQLAELSALQRRLAADAGLESCNVDFIQTFASGGATP